MNSQNRQHGFTLIELVITITLMGILAGAMSQFISGPILSYMAMSSNANNVELIRDAFYQVSREVRNAVPGSVRVSADGKTLELLRIEQGLQYAMNSSDTTENLSFDHIFSPTLGNAQFRVYGAILPDIRANIGEYELIVNHVGSYTGDDPDSPVVGQNAYATMAPFTIDVDDGAGGTITRTVYGHSRYNGTVGYCDGASPGLCGVTSSIAGQDIITMTPVHNFPVDSPNHALYFVKTPVTYHCDLSQHKITKHWDYPIAPTMGTPPSGSEATLVNKVEGCRFAVVPQSTEYPLSLVMMEITLKGGLEGSQVTLQEMVHVRNEP